MNMKKTLVILAIEDALCGMDEPVLEQVYNKLYSEYHCMLPDCYESPKYLNSALKTH